ncbi:CotH kinase family protein [Myxococcota bacterium]|nr:CotH kinase family protein [Myxococcota bacterium]
MLPLLLFVLACPPPGDGGARPGAGSDSGAADGGTGDGGTDTGTPDGGTSDGGTPDGGTTDGGTPDGGTPDGGTPDGGTSDGGTTDGGTSDGGTTDGGVEEPVGLCHIVLECPEEIPDEPKIPCHLEVRDAAKELVYLGYAGLETRGRSSAGAPKHQYSVELWDARGEEVEADLLGMGDEADWVFNGNYFDRLLVRNPLAYDLFRAAGEVGDPAWPRYAAEHRFCDLTLDGTWLGIYSLMERIKRDDDRLSIEADDGTGSSFVLKLDDGEALVSNSLGYGGWSVIYPKDPDAAQQAGITAAIQAWQAAALADPSSLPAHVDVDSVIDFILLQELMKNNDAFYLSVHLWKDRDGPLVFSPWDLDLSLGQPSYNDNENPYSWLLYRPAMVTAFRDVPGFSERLAARWAELRAGPWATGEILDRIDGYQEVMGADAIAANFEVWPIEEIDFSGYLYAVDSYEEEDARVRAWVHRRAAWMDEHIAEW